MPVLPLQVPAATKEDEREELAEDEDDPCEVQQEGNGCKEASAMLNRCG